MSVDPGKKRTRLHEPPKEKVKRGLKKEGKEKVHQYQPPSCLMDMQNVKWSVYITGVAFDIP
jgi:hypothetical protein